MKSLLLILFIGMSFLLRAQEPVIFQIDLAEVNAYEKIYNFVVDDFENITGWQFNMAFDGDKMQFKEIRNSILDDLDSHDFNDPFPGELRTVWIDTDLEATDYMDSTVVFQIVFDIVQAGGSSLCFSDEPLEWEIIARNDFGQFELSEVIIDDYCNESLLLNLTSTAVVDQDNKQTPAIEAIHLSTSGELSFNSIKEQNQSVVLYNLLGVAVSSIESENYSKGRNLVDFGKGINGGIYLLQFRSQEGIDVNSLIFAY